MKEVVFLILIQARHSEGSRLSFEPKLFLKCRVSLSSTSRYIDRAVFWYNKNGLLWEISLNIAKVVQ